MTRLGYGDGQPIDPIGEKLYMWALIDSIEPFSTSRGAALALSLDVMATEERSRLAGLSPLQPECVRRVSIVKQRYLPARLTKQGDRDPLREGEWLRITIGPRVHRGTPAVVEGPFLGLSPNEDASGHPFQTAVVGEVLWLRRATPTEARNLAAQCTVAVPTARFASIVGQPAIQDNRVKVHDVGQANCATVFNDSKVVGFFDVGRPLFFNASSWPRSFPPLSVPKTGFVALSHWDYDHYALALTTPALLGLDWIAPAPARPGPTVSALIHRLGSRIQFATAPVVSIGHGISLYRCSGPPSDRNNSGYVMRLKSRNGAKLLTGDAAYSHIPSAAKRGLCALWVTHHGGGRCGIPPAPYGKSGRAAVSFGAPNCYGHPDTASLTAHLRAGWKLLATNWTAHPALAHKAATKITRGDIWI